MATFSTLTGLTWLEGRSDVFVVGDGGLQGPFTVTDGTLTLTTPVTKGYVGLAYQGLLKTLPCDRGVPGSLSRHASRNLERVGIEYTGFLQDISVNPNYRENAVTVGQGYARLPSRRVTDNLGQAVPPRAELYDPEIKGDWSDQMHITVQSGIGLPAQIHVIEFEVQANG